MTSKRMIRRISAAAAATGIGLALAASPAAAHVSPAESEAPAGSYTVVDLRVPHGCGNLATDTVEVQIPDGITSVTPLYLPGWTVEKEKETLDEPIDDGHGGELTERDAVVSWTAGEGNELPDGQLLVFGLSLRTPDAEGETLYFKTIQHCGDDTADWTAEWDGTGDEPDNPAPAVTLTASTGGGHGHSHGDEGGDDHGDGDDSVHEGTEAAGETVDDGGSGNALGIAGLVAGLGGLALGGAAFATSKKG